MPSVVHHEFSTLPYPLFLPPVSPFNNLFPFLIIPSLVKAGTVDMTIDFEVKLYSTCPDVIDSIELFGLTYSPF